MSNYVSSFFPTPSRMAFRLFDSLGEFMHKVSRPSRAALAAGNRRRRMRGGWLLAIALTILGLCLLVAFAALVLRLEYAYIPDRDELLNPQTAELDQAYDIWGERISSAEAKRLLQTPEGRERLSLAHGAVAIDDALLELGRESFYLQTFNNERFLSDVLGLLDGAISPWDIGRALIELRGRGTNNLQVRLSKTVEVGGRVFEEGSVIDTGLDVAKGAYVPMGIKISYDRGRVRAGITCAACHSTFDPVSERIVEGATNQNFNLGTMIALAANSTAFFTHTNVELDQLIDEYATVMELPDGGFQRLPDPAALEAAVERVFLAWPPGSFDSTIDLVANPTRIPDSFTDGDHPFSWTGSMSAGPFRGLSVLNNNVHTVGSDALADAPAAPMLFDLHPEAYLAILMRNAPYQPLRYQPGGRLPSHLLEAEGHWSPAPGLNDLVQMPTYPAPSLIATNALVTGTPTHTVWQENNAMSAFQDRLLPPPPPEIADVQVRRHGRSVFADAGCVECHAGPALTNNRVIPLAEIGTAPARAPGLAALTEHLAEPITQALDTRIPIPDDARLVQVPVGHLDPEQLSLAWAADGEGGYKVKGLRGLYWNAPYLHDGGVAVGEDPESAVGVAATLGAGVRVDPENSLLGLIDRELRARIIEANAAEAQLREIHVMGIGHELWVDEEAGFSEEDQQALIAYLMWPEELPAAEAE